MNQPLHYRASQAAKRAPNWVFGLALGSVVAGTYFFSMYRVKQESFDDLEVELKKLESK